MRKTAAILAICLMATSCVVEKAHTHRQEYALHNMTGMFWEISCSQAVIALEQACRIQDFINAGDEEKKDSRFSDIGYYASEGKYVIEYVGEFYPDGNDIGKPGSKWKSCNGACGSMTIECTGEKSWEIRPAVEDNTYHYYGGPDIGDIDYTTEVLMLSSESDGLHKWSVMTEGTYVENSTYSAEFRTPAEVIMSWKKESLGTSFTTSLMAKGRFHVSILIGGREADWCEYVTDNGKHSYTTSMDEE